MHAIRKTYLPAAGKDWLLPLYDPFTKVLGVEASHRELINQAGINPGQQVLEIGCGTGNLAILVKRLNPASQVVASRRPQSLLRARPGDPAGRTPGSTIAVGPASPPPPAAGGAICGNGPAGAGAAPGAAPLTPLSPGSDRSGRIPGRGFPSTPIAGAGSVAVLVSLSLVYGTDAHQSAQRALFVTER